MESFKLEVEEEKRYWQRMLRNAFINSIYVIVLIIAFILFKVQFNSVPEELAIIILSFALLTFASEDDCRWFLKSIEINNNRVIINYSKRNEQFTMEDSLDSFLFRIGHGSRGEGNIDYLQIIHNSKVVLRQYEKWGWNKNQNYERLIDYLTNNNLLYANSFLGFRTTKIKPNK